MQTPVDDVAAKGHISHHTFNGCAEFEFKQLPGSKQLSWLFSAICLGQSLSVSWACHVVVAVIEWSFAPHHIAATRLRWQRAGGAMRGHVMWFVRKRKFTGGYKGIAQCRLRSYAEYSGGKPGVAMISR
jgi:hypothetical protein